MALSDELNASEESSMGPKEESSFEGCCVEEAPPPQETSRPKVRYKGKEILFINAFLRRLARTMPI